MISLCTAGLQTLYVTRNASPSPALGEGHEQAHELQRVPLLVPARPAVHTRPTSTREPRPPAHQQHTVCHHGDDDERRRCHRSFADGPKHQAQWDARDPSLGRGERGVARFRALRDIGIEGTGSDEGHMMTGAMMTGGREFVDCDDVMMEGHSPSRRRRKSRLRARWRTIRSGRATRCRRRPRGTSLRRGSRARSPRRS